MCIQETTVENYTETDNETDNETEPDIVVQEIPIEDVCPNLEPLVEFLEPQYDNPYNMGTTYIALTLPEAVTDSYQIVDNYEIIYPYGRRFFCLKIFETDNVYEFKCLDWHIKNVTDGEVIEKKLNLIIETELEFEGFRNSIVSNRYIRTDCRDA